MGTDVGLLADEALSAVVVQRLPSEGYGGGGRPMGQRDERLGLGLRLVLGVSVRVSVRVRG